ncbi:Lrp/AsnC ligand binding domain-containing protein [Scleromatobacter humisilvae]|uniref:Lrp/AsnC ligand binding domain-containing protein n=1 Tax=Scleromatobacter humisilvae TaxID=2897159 RepID=UPI003B849A2D
MSTDTPDLQRAAPAEARAGRERPARARSRPRGREETAAAADAAVSTSLDEVDLRLLRVLQSDGRITNLKLAAAVGLSSASTHERVKRLVRDGTILGFNARLNPNLLQAGLLVFAEVRLAAMSNAVNEAFKAAVQLRPEILECHEVAGGFDYLLKTRVAHMGAYRDLVAAVAWSLPGVRDVRTYAVMEELKNTTALPV